MTTAFTKNQVGLAAACALALSLASGAASAQGWNHAPANERELWVATNSQVWMNSYGECWHSSFGPPPAADGICAPRPVAQYVAPAPVAAAPPPPPRPAPIVVAAADPKPVYDRVSFDANVLFDFDKTVLRPAGRATLDEFIGKTRDLVDPTSFVAVGYADRFGTDSYNQALSERRVATVKNYLISKGIPEGRVGTSGKGENAPTTRPGDCTGAKNANTIACLQPDRHVFIELTGMRLRK
jgi:OOP family OmpA-OmpF porin